MYLPDASKLMAAVKRHDYEAELRAEFDSELVGEFLRHVKAAESPDATWIEQMRSHGAIPQEVADYVIRRDQAERRRVATRTSR